MPEICCVWYQIARIKTTKTTSHNKNNTTQHSNKLKLKMPHELILNWSLKTVSSLLPPFLFIPVSLLAWLIDWLTNHATHTHTVWRLTYWLYNVSLEKQYVNALYVCAWICFIRRKAFFFFPFFSSSSSSCLSNSDAIFLIILYQTWSCWSCTITTTN